MSNHFLTIRLVIIVSCAYASGFVFVPVTEAADTDTKPRQSVVRIKVSGPSSTGGNQTFWGTGFFVSEDGYILTTLHTLKAADFWLTNLTGKPDRSIDVWWIDPTTQSLVTVEASAQFVEEDQIPGKDVALIKIPGTGYKEVRCRKSDPLLEKKTYHRLGYIEPRNKQYEFNTRPARRVESTELLKPRYTFSVESKEGMSGGPIVDGRGIVRAYITSGPDGVVENKLETYGLHIKEAESLLPHSSRCKGGLNIEDGSEDAIEAETDLTTLLDFSELQLLNSSTATRYRSIQVFGNYTNESLATIIFGTAINMGTFEYYSVSARKVSLREHRSLSRPLADRQQVVDQKLDKTAKIFEGLFDAYGKKGEEIGYFRYEKNQQPISRGGDIVRLIGENTQPRIESIPGGVRPLSDSNEKDEVVVVCIESRTILHNDASKVDGFGHMHLYDTQRSIMFGRVDKSLSIDTNTVRKILKPATPMIEVVGAPLIKKSGAGTLLDLVNIPKQLKAELKWGWELPR